MSCRQVFVRLLFSLLSMSATPAVARADTYFRTYADAVVHWVDARVEVAVDPRLVARFGPEFVRAVTAAADAWQVTDDVPLFEVAPPGAVEGELGAPQVWIGLGDHLRFERELAITYTTTDAPSGEVLYARVWLNPAAEWSVLPDLGDGATDRYDLQAVLTHEFGHVLGLDEDDQRAGATMYPEFHRGEVHQRTLAQSDEDAVSGLYGMRGDLRPAGCATLGRVSRFAGYLPIFVAIFVLVLARSRSSAGRVAQALRGTRGASEPRRARGTCAGRPAMSSRLGGTGDGRAATQSVETLA